MNILLLSQLDHEHGQPIPYILRPIELKEDSITFWSKIDVESISLILRYLLQYMKKVEANINSH